MAEQKQHTSFKKFIEFFKKHSYSLFVFFSFLAISIIIIYQVNKEKKTIVAVEKNETPLIKLYRNLDFAGEKRIYIVDLAFCARAVSVMLGKYRILDPAKSKSIAISSA